jgi:hypothetical protein
LLINIYFVIITLKGREKLAILFKTCENLQVCGGYHKGFVPPNKLSYYIPKSQLCSTSRLGFLGQFLFIDFSFGCEGRSMMQGLGETKYIINKQEEGDSSFMKNETFKVNSRKDT